MSATPGVAARRRYQRIKQLYLATRELAPGPRDGLLDRICGADRALRAAVRELIDQETGDGPTVPAVPLAAPRPAPSSGDRVGPYQLVRTLGAGGTGVVHLATDTRLARLVALKFLAPRAGETLDARRRLLDEARAASALDHPNICTVYDVGETDGQTWMAMAYCSGETLQEALRRGPLPLERALSVAFAVCRGLAAAHRRGIVHRDVKPANLILGEEGDVKILDFGIAAPARHSAPAGEPVGTPGYMAPEQVRGGVVGPPADVWAVGALLYEMLGGAPPFPGARVAALLYAVVHEAPRPLADLCPGVPAAVAELVERCLQKDPADRYPDAAALLAALGDADRRRGAGAASPRRIAAASVRPFAQRKVLEGFHHLSGWSLGSAVEAFRAAAATDPDCAPAWVGLARVHALQGLIGWRPATEAYADAEEAARQALARDPDSAGGLTALAQVETYRGGDLRAAWKEAQRAVDLDPGAAFGHHIAAGVALAFDDPDAAVHGLERTLELDPLDRCPALLLARAHLRRHAFDGAVAASRDNLELFPDMQPSRELLWRALWFGGRAAEARAEAEKLPGERGALLAAFSAGRLAEARRLAATAEDAWRARLADGEPAMLATAALAENRALLGDADATLAWIEKLASLTGGAFNASQVLPLPDVDFLRADPRFAALLARLGLPASFARVGGPPPSGGA